MNFQGAKVPPDGGRYAKALGGFIMNFNVIEMQTYLWIMMFTSGFKFPAGIAAMTFSDRVDFIFKAVRNAKVPKQLKEAIYETWKEARRYSELRNIVAHSPMLWGQNENGTLVALIPNVKRALRGKQPMIVQYDDIHEAVDQVAALYPRLQELMNTLGVDMGLRVPSDETDIQTST